MNRKLISATTIKIIACISMLIDHLAASILRVYVTYPELMPVWMASLGGREQWYTVYRTMRIIGRIAFPLYLFLLSEGMFHTKSRLKYALRMVIFLLISEIPFDLALFWHRGFPDWSHQNVYFTLLLGLIAISGIIFCRGIYDRLQNYTGFLLWCLASCVPVFLCIYLGNVLHTDYGSNGVRAAVIMYVLRIFGPWGFILGIISLALDNELEWWAMAGLPLIVFYSGERADTGKRKGNALKYFFYAYYPLHLILLFVIRYIIVGF